MPNVLLLSSVVIDAVSYPAPSVLSSLDSATFFDLVGAGIAATDPIAISTAMARGAVEYDHSVWRARRQVSGRSGVGSWTPVQGSYSIRDKVVLVISAVTVDAIAYAAGSVVEFDPYTAADLITSGYASGERGAIIAARSAGTPQIRHASAVRVRSVSGRVGGNTYSATITAQSVPGTLIYDFTSVLGSKTLVSFSPSNGTIAFDGTNKQVVAGATGLTAGGPYNYTITDSAGGTYTLAVTATAVLAPLALNSRVGILGDSISNTLSGRAFYYEWLFARTGQKQFRNPATRTGTGATASTTFYGYKAGRGGLTTTTMENDNSTANDTTANPTAGAPSGNFGFASYGSVPAGSTGYDWLGFMISTAPKLVLYLLGTNDLTGATISSGPGIIANITSHIQRLRANNIRIILCTILPRFNITADQETVRGQVNNFIRSQATSDGAIRVADFDTINYTAADTQDGVLHPNASGAYKMSGAVIAPFNANFVTTDYLDSQVTGAQNFLVASGRATMNGTTGTLAAPYNGSGSQMPAGWSAQPSVAGAAAAVLESVSGTGTTRYFQSNWNAGVDYQGQAALHRATGVTATLAIGDAFEMVIRCVVSGGSTSALTAPLGGNVGLTIGSDTGLDNLSPSGTSGGGMPDGTYTFKTIPKIATAANGAITANISEGAISGTVMPSGAYTQFSEVMIQKVVEAV